MTDELKTTLVKRLPGAVHVRSSALHNVFDRRREKVRASFVRVHGQSMKETALGNILKADMDSSDNNNKEEQQEQHGDNASEVPKTMIFCNTAKSCRFVLSLLHRSVPFSWFAGYYGELPVLQREASWRRFSDARSDVRYLVCTDLASRGLDLMSIERVIMFDMPSSTVDYLQRAGRIRSRGEVVALVNSSEQYAAALAFEAHHFSRRIDDVGLMATPTRQSRTPGKVRRLEPMWAHIGPSSASSSSSSSALAHLGARPRSLQKFKAPPSKSALSSSSPSTTRLSRRDRETARMKTASSAGARAAGESRSDRQKDSNPWIKMSKIRPATDLPSPLRAFP